MTKLEAIKAMCDGKKITNINWDDEEYVYMLPDGRCLDESKTEYSLVDLSLVNLKDTDNWSIYEEPKKIFDYNVKVTLGGWDDLKLTVRSFEPLNDKEIIEEATSRLFFHISRED